MDEARHIRNGVGAVRPYVFGSHSLLGFLQDTFSAEVVERSPDGGEVELRIGDSALALALGDEFPEGVATRASVYVYVEDADATYGLALRNGRRRSPRRRTSPTGNAPAECATTSAMSGTSRPTWEAGDAARPP
jgi:hypothetical protein